MSNWKKRVIEDTVPADSKCRLLSTSGFKAEDPVQKAVARTCKAQGVLPLMFIYACRNEYGGVFFGACSDEENVVLVGETSNGALTEWLSHVLLESATGNGFMAEDILRETIEYRNGQAKDKGYEDTYDYYQKTLIEPYDKAVEMKREAKQKELDSKEYLRELNRKAISKRKEE